jgi:hypothetical protein
VRAFRSCTAWRRDGVGSWRSRWGAHPAAVLGRSLPFEGLHPSMAAAYWWNPSRRVSQPATGARDPLGSKPRHYNIPRVGVVDQPPLAGPGRRSRPLLPPAVPHAVFTPSREVAQRPVQTGKGLFEKEGGLLLAIPVQVFRRDLVPGWVRSAGSGAHRSRLFFWRRRVRRSIVELFSPVSSCVLRPPARTSQLRGFVSRCSLDCWAHDG